jgi:hypothetical protein
MAKLVWLDVLPSPYVTDEEEAALRGAGMRESLSGPEAVKLRVKIRNIQVYCILGFASSTY